MLSKVICIREVIGQGKDCVERKELVDNSRKW